MLISGGHISNRSILCSGLASKTWWQKISIISIWKSPCIFLDIILWQRDDWSNTDCGVMLPYRIFSLLLVLVDIVIVIVDLATAGESERVSYLFWSSWTVIRIVIFFKLYKNWRLLEKVNGRTLDSTRLHWRFLLRFQEQFCGDFKSPL